MEEATAKGFAIRLINAHKGGSSLESAPAMQLLTIWNSHVCRNWQQAHSPDANTFLAHRQCDQIIEAVLTKCAHLITRFAAAVALLQRRQHNMASIAKSFEIARRNFTQWTPFA